MHHIHTTGGLIIQSKPHGEANRIVHIMTRDLGLVIAIAQGIRFERSKLRYFVQDYRFANFSLVQGKEFWRIVGANELGIYEECVEPKTKIIRSKIIEPILHRASYIIMRLIQGEEKREEIYDCLWDFYNIKLEDREYSQDFVNTAESILILRILFWLGYVGENSTFGSYVNQTSVDQKIIDDLIPKRVEMNKLINNALRESHL